MRTQTFDRSGKLVSETLWDSASLKRHVSVVRYERETSGIIVDGQFLSTNRDEIGHWYPRFSNAWGWLHEDPMSRAGNPEGIYPYKPRGGKPVILTAQQVLRCYDRLAWYINACFGAEKNIYEAIDAAETPEQLDATAGTLDFYWPPREFTQ
jgi:hypothetical protein